MTLSCKYRYSYIMYLIIRLRLVRVRNMSMFYVSVASFLLLFFFVAFCVSWIIWHVLWLCTAMFIYSSSGSASTWAAAASWTAAAAKCMTVICSHERITVTNSQRLNSTYLLESLLVLLLNSVALRRFVQSAVSPYPTFIYRERYDGSAAFNNTAPKGQPWMSRSKNKKAY